MVPGSAELHRRQGGHCGQHGRQNRQDLLMDLMSGMKDREKLKITSRGLA